MIFRDRHGRATRGTFIVVLLLSTLVLAGALAYQALDSVASHRATANSVLEDYAAFAAEQYAERASQALDYYGIRPAIGQLAYRYLGQGESDVPTVAELRANANRTLEQSLDLVLYLFRFDPRSGTVVAAPDEERDPPDWLGSALAEHVASLPDTLAGVSLALVDGTSGLRAFAYVVYDDEANGETVGYGLEADPEELRSSFRTSFGRAPILPPSLTGGVSYDSVLAVRLVRPGGEEFLRLTNWAESPTPFPGPVATRSLPGRMGDLAVQVRIDPTAAEMLVIGGLPSSRLPFIFGIFLLTAGLIAAALLQFRRERELDRLRTEFVSNVSHELRTPLAQIRMFAETLLLGRVRSEHERVRSLEIIDKEARRLAHLVENVLHFSRSERSTVRLEPGAIDVARLLKEVVESFRPLATARQTTVTLDTERLVVTADRGAIQQIVLNLLDNAIKYGPTGQEVRVWARLADGWAQVCVEDEGPGIPPADRERVWTRFGRLDRERESAVAGNGIGLSVVRELTHLHGGRCRVDAGDRGGARFTVELPGARPEVEQMETEIQASAVVESSTGTRE